MIAKLRILFWIGILTLFLPYFGVRSGLRTVITILIGVAILWLTFRIRKEYKALKYKMRRLEEPSVGIEITTSGQ